MIKRKKTRTDVSYSNKTTEEAKNKNEKKRSENIENQVNTKV